MAEIENDKPVEPSESKSEPKGRKVADESLKEDEIRSATQAEKERIARTVTDLPDIELVGLKRLFEEAARGIKRAFREKPGEAVEKPVKATDRPDGGKHQEFADGSVVEVNARGQVEKIVGPPPRHATREIHYNEKGEPDQIKGMDGHTWSRDPRNPDLWRSDTGETWKGKLRVDEGGGIHYQPARGFPPSGGRPFELTRAGSIEMERPDAHARHREGGDRPAARGGDRTGERHADKPAEKPADKPADKPAEKPADKPAEKPADKPADKPAEKPADKPAEKPADKPAEKPPEKAVDRAAMEKRADKLYKAADGWGTDEDAIYKALEGTTEAERKVMNEIYKQKHGVTIEDMLRDEMSGLELDKAMNLLKKKDAPAEKPADKPSGEKPEEKVDEAKVDKAVQDIHKAVDGWGTDEDAIYAALKDKSGAERKAINDAYLKKYGVTLEQQFKDEMSGTDLEKALNYLNPERGSRPTDDKAKAEEAKVDRAAMEKAAAQIYKACDGWGTDEDAIFKALDGKTRAERDVLNQIYKEKYELTLEQQFKDELSGSDLDRAMRALNRKDAKPEETPAGVDRARVEALADKIYKACDGWGTDEGAIHKALEGTTKGERELMNKIYQEKYGRTLESQFRDEMSGDDLGKAMALLKRDETHKPAAGVDVAAMEKAAKDIHDAADGWGTDEGKIFKTLQGKTKEEIAEINRIYQEKYGMTLEEEMRDEMSGSDLDKALNLLEGKDYIEAKIPEGVDRAAIEERAMKIRDACDGWGTDEGKIFKALEGTSEAERKALQEIYLEKYGLTLAQQLQDEMGGSDLTRAMALLNKRDGAGSAEEQAVDRAAMEERVKKIYDAADGWGTDESAIFKALEGTSEAERKVMNQIYLERHGKTIAEEIADEMSGGDRKKAEKLLYAKGIAGQDAPPDPSAAEDYQATAKKIFDQIDSNKDGYLSKGELEKAQSSGAFQGQEKKVVDALAKYRTDLEEASNDEWGDENDGITRADLNSQEAGDLLRTRQREESLAERVAAKGDEAAAKVDRNAMEKATEAIRDAFDKDDWVDWGTDNEKVFKVLEGKTDAERQMIMQLYRQKYGTDLEKDLRDEMSGSDLEKALNLLYKKEGDKTDDAAGRINQALKDFEEWGGKSESNCEKDIRDTLAVLNSEQIAQIDQEYRARYGKGLRDALMESGVSAETKETLDIYLKGVDKRTDDDTLKLADIAIRSENSEMFNEAMANASPEARRRFLESGGNERLKDAFDGHWYNALTFGLTGNVTDTELTHTQDFAEKGKLSAATQIRDNTSIIGDNEKAIEETLRKLTTEERRMYLRGKELEGKDIGSLPEEDEKAVAYYKDLRSALEGAGNATEVAKWEDMIAVKGGSVISKIAAEKGFFDDDENKVYKHIEDMSKEDWERLKKDPEYKGQILDMMRTFMNEDEVRKAEEILDKKIAAETYEQAKAVGRRSLTEALSDNSGVFSDDERSMIEAISNMTPEEQERYRTDAEFRSVVDEAVAKHLDAGIERDTARRLLEKVARGETPELDLVAKMNLRQIEREEKDAMFKAARYATGGIWLAPINYAQDKSDAMTAANLKAQDMLFGGNARDVIKDLEEEFKKNPALREELKNNPNSPQAREILAAIRGAMRPDEFERYAKPLIETGEVPADLKLEMSKGFLNDDEIQAFKDIAGMSKTERDKIVADPDKYLGFLNGEEREVALNIAKQGEIKPEDAIRMHVIGAGTGEDEIKETLAKLTPEQKEQLRIDYARKYGEDLTARLIDELGGQDKREVMRMAAREPQSDMEAYNRARDEYYESYDGFGKAWVNTVWDGTGYMAENDMAQFRARMEHYKAKFEDMPPEERKELVENLNKSIDLFVESKGAASDALCDAAIAIVAIGGAFFTEGASLSLLLATGFGAALFKVGAKAAIMGSDYDFASAQVLTDAATGFVDGFLSFAGPAEVAKILRVGAQTTQKAAGAVGTQLLERGLLKVAGREAEEAVEQGVKKLVTNAIVNGSYDISQEAAEKMAVRLIKEGVVDAEKIGAQLMKNGVQDVEKLSKVLAREGLADAEKLSAKLVKDGTVNAKNLAAVLAREGVPDAEKLAARLIKEGVVDSPEKALARLIAESANPEMAALKASKSALKRKAEEYAFNMGGGALGGGGSGFVRGVAEWDPNLSFAENMKRVAESTLISASIGGAMAGAFTAGFKGLARGYQGLRNAFGKEPVDIHINGKLMPETKEPVHIGRADFDGHPEVSRNHLSLARDDKGNVLLMDHSTNGTYIKRTGSNEFERLAEGQVVQLKPGDEVRLGSPEGPRLNVEAKPKAEAPDVRKPGEMRERTDAPAVKEGGEALEIPDYRSKLKVEFENSPYLRQIKLDDGSEVGLSASGSWWMKTIRAHKTPNGSPGPVKVHVTTTGADDLGKLQEVLIPALEKDPELAKYVVQWKTMDPTIHTHGRTDAGVMPTGREQGAKGFTIYTDTEAEALAIQKRIDDILQKHGLSLDHPIDTGNVDVVRGGSNRVGITRDHVELVRSADGRSFGGKVDDGLQARIEQKMGLEPGQRLSFEQLRQVEREAGIRAGLLDYTADCHLMLKGTTGSGTSYKGRWYLDEFTASKEFGDLTERPAMYGLADWAGVDRFEFTAGRYSPDAPPAHPVAARPIEESPVGTNRTAELNRAAVPGSDAGALPEGSLIRRGNTDINKGPIEIGRNHVLPDGRPLREHPQVSRDHGSLRWDEKEKAYFFKDHSTYGTYVKRQGTDHWVLINNQEVKLGPRDVIRLGTPDGPEIHLSTMRKPELAGFRRATDAEVYIGDNKLAMHPNGTVEVGRAHRLGDQGPLITDTRVSRHHGSLRYNQGDNSFYYRDHSSNGTWIKREGSDQFELVKNAEVKVGPRDEIRLGSPDGPVLNLVAKTQSEVLTAAETAAGKRIYLAGKQLEVGSGEVVIGRQHVAARNDLLDTVVSRNHGTVRMDEKTGQLIYRDTSTNGTYIKRANSERWELVHNREVRINPGDEVRLGSQYGPELKLATTRGEVQPDGSVLFRRPEGDLWHNQDGSQTFSDRAGIHRWTDANGRVTDVRDTFGRHTRFEYDQSGNLRKIVRQDGLSFESNDGVNWVKRNPDGTTVNVRGRMEVQPDGSIKVINEGQPPLVYGLDGATEIHHPNGRIEYQNASFNVERARLSTLSDVHFSTVQQKQRFEQYMRSFEQRARSMGLSEQEVALTYHHINRLIQGGPDSALAQAERLRLAEQLLHQSAYPHLIDQGFNSTCNVTTVEKRIFTKRPSEAVRLVTDVATTGKYVTANGSVVDMARVPGALKPDSEALSAMNLPFNSNGADVKLDGRRTFASQIFETTAANIKWAEGGQFRVNPSDVVMYEKPLSPGHSGTGDTGERLYRYEIGADGRLKRVQVSDQPHIYEWELTNIHNQITGANDSGFVIHGPGRGPSDGSSGSIQVRDAADLERVLTQNRDYPAIISVHTRHEPFWTDSGAGRAGGSGGWHVVNVVGVFKGGDGRWYAQVTNQWGLASQHITADRAIPIDQLFAAMQAPTVASTPPAPRPSAGPAPRRSGNR